MTKRQIRNKLRTELPKSKRASKQDPHPYCQCGQDIGLVRVVTSEGEHLCITCFEIAYPRMASVNRLKKTNEQLELPF